MQNCLYGFCQDIDSANQSPPSYHILFGCHRYNGLSFHHIPMEVVRTFDQDSMLLKCEECTTIDMQLYLLIRYLNRNIPIVLYVISVDFKPSVLKSPNCDLPSRGAVCISSHIPRRYSFSKKFLALSPDHCSAANRRP